MALLWLPSQHCIVAAKQGERRPSLGLSEGGQAAAAAKGQSEGLTQHRPANPRHASSPEGQGRLTAALQVAPDALASSLALRKLVCPSGSRVPCPVGAASQVPDPQPLRRGLHDKQSPLFSTTPPALRPSSPPAAVTVPACKLLAGNKRLCSGRTRGASPPLSRRAVRSAAAGRNCSGGGRLSSPFQHRHSRRPARAAPLEARERAARTAREEDGGGANREPRWEGRGRRQGLEAEAPREGRPGVGEKDPRTSRTIRLPLTLSTPVGVGEPLPARVSVEEQSWSHRANPLTKESPTLLPLPPLLSNPRDTSPAQGRTQKGRPRLPYCQPVVARATRGPICQ